MNKRSISAIEKALKDNGEEDNKIYTEDNRVEITLYCSGTDEDGEFSFVTGVIHVHKLKDGRWMRAHWSTKNLEWQSSDFTHGYAKINPNACYCFARTLEALAGDIKTYPSAIKAIRAAFPSFP